MGKLKVLCIHGYRQNETIFREKTGAFRKLVKKHIDFYFISAPHIIPEEQNLVKSEAEQERGWWFSKPNKSYRALDQTDTCIGFEESLQLIQTVFETHGPFDGLLGFSQGASFVSLLCILKNDPKYQLDFKFVVIIAGFKSLVTPHVDMYSELIDCPSFHTVGETDAVIPAQSSEDLQSVFISPVVYRHSGGHYMPASPHLRTAITEFLTRFIH